MDAYKTSKPCDALTGTIVSASPLKVRINQKTTLTSDFVGIIETANNASLSKGDKVLMLRQSGGQKYYIIDKVVDAD